MEEKTMEARVSSCCSAPVKMEEIGRDFLDPEGIRIAWGFFICTSCGSTCDLVPS